jgi:hypothetical protein
MVASPTLCARASTDRAHNVHFDVSHLAILADSKPQPRWALSRLIEIGALYSPRSYLPHFFVTVVALFQRYPVNQINACFQQPGAL